MWRNCLGKVEMCDALFQFSEKYVQVYQSWLKCYHKMWKRITTSHPFSKRDQFSLNLLITTHRALLGIVELATFQFEISPSPSLLRKKNVDKRVKKIWIWTKLPMDLIYLGWYLQNRANSSWRLKVPLTTHNWQNGKREFLSYYWHKIYRVQAVGLKNAGFTLKIKFFCEYVKFGVNLLEN